MMRHPTLFSISPMVLTLSTLPSAELTSLIASGVPIIPPSSTYMMTKEIGSPSIAFLIKRQVSYLLG
jgi:hypothetical protein